jgi:S1-C subfamily serine protease
LFALVLFGALLPGIALAGGDASSVSLHTKRSTAYITARVSDRSEAVGAGVIIAVSPNVIVLTARHLAARKNLALRTYGGELLRIVAEYEVADRDLALIIASGPCIACEAAETADAITVGEPIHVWGNPQGNRYVLSAGTVVDLHPSLPGFATNGRFALACESCDAGDSGGGVFDDRGRLLGIVTEGWDGLNAGEKRVIAEPANHALAHVPLEYVARSAETPRRASLAARGRVNIGCVDPDAAAEQAVSELRAGRSIVAYPDVSAIISEARMASMRAIRQCLGAPGTRLLLSETGA